MLKFFTYLNSKIGYSDIGAGPVILWGHSYLFDKSSFAFQIDKLSKNFRCIAVDLWGHGDSSKLPEEINSFRDIAKVMSLLMDDLNITQYSIVSQAFSARWAIELAQLQPEKLASLVCVGSFVGTESEVMKDSFNTLLQEVEKSHQVTDAIARFIAPFMFCEATYQKKYYLVEQFITRMQSTPVELLETFVKLGYMLVNRSSQWSSMLKIKTPILFMTGKYDLARPIEEAKLMQNKMPQSELAIIEKAANMITIEQPQQSLEWLEKFFNTRLIASV